MNIHKFPLILFGFIFSITLMTSCGDSSTDSNDDDSSLNKLSNIIETPDVIGQTQAVICPDGNIVENELLCSTEGVSNTVTLFICGDGTQVQDSSLCPTIYTCPDGVLTYDKNSCIVLSSSSEILGESSSLLINSSSSNEIINTSSNTLISSVIILENSSSSILTLSSSQDIINPPSITQEGVVIKFENNQVVINNNNNCVTQEGNSLTITCGGDYKISGNSNDNQIIVSAQKTDKVYLYLNNLKLKSAVDAPIYIQNADKVFLVLEDNSNNSLEDAKTRTKNFEKINGKIDTTNATIYSKDDLTIKGIGSLEIIANYNNGIHSTNDLRFKDSPNIKVTSKNHSIKGKGSVTIEGGKFTLKSTEGDGIKSDEFTVNGRDTTITEGKGLIKILGGEIDITSGDDGIQAYNYIMFADSVSSPNVTIKSTGRGIKTKNNLFINAGNIDVNAKNDGIRAGINLYFNGGKTTVSAEKGSNNNNNTIQGVHADSTLYINDGSVNVTKAEEGFEAYFIKASGGKTAVYTSNDAWNGAGGDINSDPNANKQFSESVGHITITGGYHYLYASGNMADALDANGNINISGGVIILELGQSSGMGGMGGWGGWGGFGGGGNNNGACPTMMSGGLIDYDGSYTQTGGTILGFGSETQSYPGCTSLSYEPGEFYGTNNAAFKPTVKGSLIIHNKSESAGKVDVSTMKQVELPNGMIYYYK